MEHAELKVADQIPLAPMSTLGLGGPARWFAQATHQDDVALAQRWCGERGVDLFVVGGGSNLVIADSGFNGLVLRMDILGQHGTTTADGEVMTAAAGEVWDDVVAAAVKRGLAGIECLSGIPGRVGGT